ncbi:5-(carboxyamino)imidazole ribonucleotide synthase [Pelagicoccus sp. SDUM812002]|uniref:5-(carboxyamino)imidazole ribonucleotide synthase n=1 Tax=Pelagicoccus sp. SDUM812002 TaxID=3041266 RepID=UPI00280EC16E|nr:5-(carboxyamino)imidazole ribonucleotide synthase [Pelagicoccus sp. SDUM812002]MDQ8185105.1 5-(carboxyamino)imidazole ribonucleotide synthase [Pelagicoccus sp. SDUM812002]
MIAPGSTIGILGGGQLGRMTGQAARSLGYGFVVFEPQRRCPAGHVADLEINAKYSDKSALELLADSSDVVTYEFENVPVEATHELEEKVTLHPRPEILHICQNREREKNFLRDNGIPCAPFAIVDSLDDLDRAIAEIGTPAVLKTAAFGYDGKGQLKISNENPDTAAIWKEFGEHRAVLEGWMDFTMEISVLVAANEQGEVSTFPVAENIHTNHILDYSIVPARISPELRAEAEGLAKEIARKLGLVGLLGVELFILRDGTIAVNELAPRPHNSGHYTIDACVTSQFEQFVRAVCGLPLGSTKLLSPVTMVNILGDAWIGRQPDFAELLKHPSAKLHLYGKAQARVGRKMGHFCVLADSADTSFELAKKLKAKL